MRKPTADICLYGNRETGSGWLAALPDGHLLGDGEPMASRMFTEAIWQAQDALVRAGLSLRTPVRIFDVGGMRIARATVALIPPYGDLKWEAAPFYVLEVAHA